MTVNGITNVGPADVALVDLLVEGTTAAPPDAVSMLVTLGHAEYAAGRLSLTKAGRARALALRPSENTLRRLFINAQSGSPLRGVSGGLLRT